MNRNDKVCGDRLATGPRPSPCYDVWSCAYPEAFLSGGVGHDVFIGGRYHELLLGGRGPDVLRGFRWEDRLVGGRGEDLLVGGPGG